MAHLDMVCVRPFVEKLNILTVMLVTGETHNRFPSVFLFLVRKVSMIDLNVPI